MSRIDPNNIRSQLMLASALDQRKEFDQAIERARHVVQIAPGYASAYRYLGKVLNQRGRHDEAAQFLRQGLAQAPYDPELHLSLGHALLGISDRQRTGSATANRESPAGPHSDGDARAEVEEAAAQFEIAFRLERDRARAHWLLA